MLEFIDVSNLTSIYLIPWGKNIVLAIVIFVIGLIVTKILVRVAKKLLINADVDNILVSFIGSILNWILLLVVIVASLSQLGINTTSLIALIGAAGLAIGLSLKDSLQNFAAGVMLIMFRPFKEGDFVETAGSTGSVVSINIFSTTLKTIDNKEVIVPNGAIYKDVITNYSANATRRVDMVFGIGYEDDILKAREIISNILSADERILKDPEPLIVVVELGDSSVNIEARPWVKTSDYLQVKFDITERVKLAFDQSGITIPYPQMDVHLNKLE